MDGKVCDIKVITSPKLDRLVERIKDCDSQRANTACLHITETSGYTKKEAIEVVRQIFGDGYKLFDKYGKLVQNITTTQVKEVCLIYGEAVSFIKK